MYARVLGLLNSQKALSHGEFFDLMYVNFNNPDFSPHSNYAYLRRHKDEVILIAVNFSDAPRELKINLPDLALGLYGITPGDRPATELISGRKATVTVSAEKPFATAVAPWGAVMWKFSASKGAPRRKRQPAVTQQDVD